MYAYCSRTASNHVECGADHIDIILSLAYFSNALYGAQSEALFDVWHMHVSLDKNQAMLSR